MLNNFKKQDLSKELSNKTGYPKTLSNKLINDVLDIFINRITNSQLILKNFGSFKLLNKKERMGRNPKTKEEFIIASRKIVKFTISKKFLSKLNNLK